MSVKTALLTLLGAGLTGAGVMMPLEIVQMIDNIMYGIITVLYDLVPE